MIFEKLSGWEVSDYKTYCQAYEKFGGSVCSHPIILKFFENKFPEQITFYHKKMYGEIIGACFSEKNLRLTNSLSKIPLYFENIILPIYPKMRICYLPVKTKELSFRHAKQFFNVSYGILNRRSICIVKNSFSKKTMRKRQAEVRKFLSHGGEILSVDFFSSLELSRIYLNFMGLRWNRIYHENDILELTKFIEFIRPMIFGSVLMFDGKPCAYDLIYKAECNDWIYFDDHNGSIDLTIKHFSLGSILLSVNIENAKKLCEEKNKECIFSIGKYKKEWIYKKLWSNEYKLGKVLV